MAGEYVIMRGFLIFDTSSIPDEAVISSAYVRLTCYDDHSDDSEFNVTVQQTKPSIPHDPLVSIDYDRRSFAGDFGHRNTSVFVNDDFFNISLSASGLADINLSGYTYWCLRSSADIASSDPGVGNDEWVMFYAPGSVHPEYGPHLIVNYTIPSSNWDHVVNLTFYNATSGLPYAVAYAVSNGTVTVSAVNFNEEATYLWNVSYNSNHNNIGSTQVYNFTTVAGGVIVVGGMVRPSLNYFVIGLVCSIPVGWFVFNRKKMLGKRK